MHISNDVDYIWYVDSDDWLKNDKVLETINDNLQEEPDVLFIGMDTYKNYHESWCFSPKYGDMYEALVGWSGSCGKVIKKELAIKPECLYNEGTLKEDKNQHCKICLNMKSFVCIPNSLYVWNRMNRKSVTTKRTNILWYTSTIRHYADTLELYLTYKGRDPIVDKLLRDRLQLCEEEVIKKGDRQF